MILKFIPQDKILELRKNHEDVLSRERSREVDYISHLRCVQCDSKVTSKLNANRLFTPGKLLPNLVMVCSKCEIEFEPYSKIVTKA